MAVRHWSTGLSAHSNALDIDRALFEKGDAREIAETLKHSAEHSSRRRGTAFRSAMSILTFYINRAGADLDDRQRLVLERAKEELRAAFGKEPARGKTS